jgi:hypothetical protein
MPARWYKLDPTDPNDAGADAVPVPGSRGARERRKVAVMPNNEAHPIWSRALRVGAVLLSAGAVITACGSGSSGGAAAGSSNVTPTVTATTPSTTTPTTASTTPTSTGNSGTLSAASFCTYAKKQKAQAAGEAKQFAADSPAELAAYTQKALAELEQFTASAPAAVKSDVQVVVVADQKVFAALKQAGYNYRNLNPQTFASLDSPALQQASAGIATYFAKTCGISSGG